MSTGDNESPRLTEKELTRLHDRSKSTPDVRNSQAFQSKYKILRQLGESRDGGVYEALSLDNSNPAARAGTKVAVKVFNLPTEKKEKDLLKKWAKWEFMGLDMAGPHPNIHQNYELITGPNRMYLVSELCDCDLYLATDLSEPMPNYSVQAVFKQMLEGLSQLHKNQMCHGDIKLENFFVKIPKGSRHSAIADPKMVDKFVVILGDFGFWASTKGKDGKNALVYGSGGSDVYGPWEQTLKAFASMGYDGQLSDIYALGVCLFTLVLGFPPWETSMDLSDPYFKLWYKGRVKTYWSVIDKHTGSRVSAEFKDLVSKMMAIDPKARPTLQEVVEHPFVTGKSLASKFAPADDVVPKKIRSMLDTEFVREEA